MRRIAAAFVLLFAVMWISAAFGWGYLTGVKPTAGLQFVATSGVSLLSNSPQTTKLQGVSRIPIVMGCDTASIKLAFTNWYIDAAHNQTDAALALQIPKVALERDSPSSTQPVLFNTAANITLATGANNIQSDALQASAFGLTVFPKNTLWYVRITYKIGSAGDLLLGPMTQQSSYPNGMTYIYDPANDIDQVYSTGVLTQPTNANGSVRAYGPIAIIGQCQQPTPSVAVFGASWTMGTLDDGPGSPAGIGMMARASLDNNTVGSDTIPFALLTRSGSRVSNAITWNKAAVFIKYANIALTDNMGANDISPGGDPAATIIQNYNIMWGIIRSAGTVQKIITMKMTPRTTSTDNWSTAANQTPEAGFGPGSTAETLNGYLAAMQARGQFDLLMTSSGIRDAGNQWLWATNGTPQWMTTEGEHPTGAVGYPSLGSELRTIIRSQAVNYLLERDLDPAANDNAPAFLDLAA